MISSPFSNLSAKTRRILAVGAIAAVAAGVMFAAVKYTSGSKKPVARQQEDVVRNVFTSANSQKLGVEGVAASVNKLESENEHLKGEIASLKSTLDEYTKRNPAGLRDSDITKIRDEVMQGLKQDSTLLQQQQQGSASGVPSLPPLPRMPGAEGIPQLPPPTPAGYQRDGESVKAPAPYAPSTRAAIPQGMTQPQNGASHAMQNRSTAQSKLALRVVERTDAKAVAAAEAKKKAAEARTKVKPEEKKEDKDQFIPAGSIFSGVLLTGLDAPTSNSAQSNPHPALLRIKAESILPNRNRADLRECFMVASGYGDMSSERAYLRAETLSCIRDDGGVIEVPVDMYASGEDGKAGIRGRLVSKQGQFLSKAMMAGFAQGVANAFQQQRVPAVNTEPGNTPLYQSNIGSTAVQNGLLNGTGMALDRLAKYYMDMAENIFPVIEIDAGRQIDFIMVHGTSLKAL